MPKRKNVPMGLQKSVQAKSKAAFERASEAIKSRRSRAWSSRRVNRRLIRGEERSVDPPSSLSVLGYSWQ
jgi:hypothetical protein